MSLDTVQIIDGNGARVSIGAVTLNGAKLPAHVFVDGFGSIVGTQVNPFCTSPGIAAVDFADRSGTVATAGAVALDIPANAARKGGYIAAPLTNSGTITVTLVRSDGTTRAFKLAAGASFSMVVNPGYVLPHEIQVSGDTVGDTFDGVEFA